jgi:hypothetical protein
VIKLKKNNTNEENNRRIIEEAKTKIKGEQDKGLASMFDDAEEDTQKKRGYDIKITIKELWAYGKGGDFLFTIDMKNIDIFEFKRLVENLETITDLVDLQTIVDKELEEEQERQFKEEMGEED